MQALQEQLSGVTRVLQNLSKTDLSSIDDAKSLKSLTFVIDRVLKVLDAEIGGLELLKLKTLSKLSVKVDAMKPILEVAEKKFMIKYQTPIARAVVIKSALLDIDIGNNIMFQCLLYATRNDIPVLGYGAIMHHSQPMVVYRFNVRDFVSITACQVMDFNGLSDNYRTICCGNSKTCEYQTGCKYFHDPIICPDSNHVQRFMRTNMVKKCPYFGHAALFAEQREMVTFENLHTLARYCAVMTLMISLVKN